MTESFRSLGEADRELLRESFGINRTLEHHREVNYEGVGISGLTGRSKCIDLCIPLLALKLELSNGRLMFPKRCVMTS